MIILSSEFASLFIFTNLFSFRYLVPNDLTAYHFNYILRKRIKLPEKDSLYFFVNGKNLLKGDTLMAQVYEKKRDPDGFLYITYTDETTLGFLEQFKMEE